MHIDHHNKFCSSCGEKNENANKEELNQVIQFCPNCGTKLITELKNKTEVEVSCTKCFKKLVVSKDKIFQVGTYCTCCGKPHQKTAHKQQHTSSSDSTGFWLIICIIAVLIYFNRDSQFVQNLFDTIKDFIN